VALIGSLGTSPLWASAVATGLISPFWTVHRGESTRKGKHRLSVNSKPGPH
jgi:hypothetical protein